ncbi:MAG: helix-turn-helix transcriptional regulator [Geobacter sp.]|nr:helix-turn-helix transcriptional regulator [Geobacter sp.]
MKTTAKKLLGARIKELRTGRGLSQEELAEMVGVDPKHLSRIETGLNAPTVDRLEILAYSLGVEMHTLFKFGHLDNHQAQIENIENMLKRLNESDLKMVYRVVESLVN